MPNPVMHFELIANQPEKLKDFYARLFGWRREEFPDIGYAYLHTDAGKGIDGGLGSPAGGLAPGLTVYVQVDDLEKALARARELGAGKVLQEPGEVPGVGRFAVFADPEGNRIGLWKLP